MQATAPDIEKEPAGMLRVGYRIAFAIGAFLACITLLNVLARWAEGPDYLADWQNELDRAGQAEVAVLGPSIAQHIYPQAMCQQGINLAGAGEDIFESEALIMHLHEAGNLPKLVIIGLFPGLFESDNGADGTHRSYRRIYAYRNLQARGDWRLIGTDWQGAVRALAFPALGYDQWQGHFRLIGDKLAKRNSIFQDPAFSQQQLTSSQLDVQQTKRFLSKRDNELASMRQHDVSISERAQKAILRINALLAANDSRLLLVTMPAGPAMSAAAPTALADDLVQLAERDAEFRAAGVLTINDLTTTDFSRVLDGFRDPIHFNRDGGMRYSRDLAQRLAARGLLPQPECAITS
ncbi:hypothetical protein [Parasphingorhabdus sp. NYA22]